MSYESDFIFLDINIYFLSKFRTRGTWVVCGSHGCGEGIMSKVIVIYSYDKYDY